MSPLPLLSPPPPLSLQFQLGVERTHLVDGAPKPIHFIVLININTTSPFVVEEGSRKQTRDQEHVASTWVAGGPGVRRPEKREGEGGLWDGHGDRTQMPRGAVNGGSQWDNPRRPPDATALPSRNRCGDPARPQGQRHRRPHRVLCPRAQETPRASVPQPLRSGRRTGCLMTERAAFVCPPERAG